MPCAIEQGSSLSLPRIFVACFKLLPRMIFSQFSVNCHLNRPVKISLGMLPMIRRPFAQHFGKNFESLAVSYYGENGDAIRVDSVLLLIFLPSLNVSVLR